MSRNSEFFFQNAGRVFWFQKWAYYAKALLWIIFIGLTLLEGVAYVLQHIH